jgi:competence protein ComGF
MCQLCGLTRRYQRLSKDKQLLQETNVFDLVQMRKNAESTAFDRPENQELLISSSKNIYAEVAGEAGGAGGEKNR